MSNSDDGGVEAGGFVRLPGGTVYCASCPAEFRWPTLGVLRRHRDECAASLTPPTKVRP